jgi:hypothetical protein
MKVSLMEVEAFGDFLGLGYLFGDILGLWYFLETFLNLNC